MEREGWADLRILIVDDSALDRRALRDSLERIGYWNVTEAESGEEGLARTKGEPFDAVIVDYVMGPLDGIRLLEHVRGLRPEAGRILVTGFASHEVAIDAINRGGVHGILLKPFTDDTLGSVVQTATHRAHLAEKTSFHHELS